MKLKASLLSFAVFLGTTPLFSASLQSEPETFDFGWAPDTARISCEFTVKNTSNDAIALQALKPACGCTAAKFSPMSLASDGDTKIGLTFNTRGYKGMTFSKSAELTTEGSASNITVYLKGHVTDPNALVFPKGTGIASFEPTAKSTTQKITLQNKSDKNLTLHVVQPPASWAKVKLGSEMIKAGGTADVTVSVSGSLKDVRETSITIEASQDDDRHRVTLAVRTGPEVTYQPIRPQESNPSRQTGPADPLKLKPIEPVRSK
jgi:hypothetical protein